MPEDAGLCRGKSKARAAAPVSVLTDLDNGYALSLNLAIGSAPKSSGCCHTRTWRAFTAMTAGCADPATFVVGRDGLGSPLRRSGFPQAHGNR